MRVHFLTTAALTALSAPAFAQDSDTIEDVIIIEATRTQLDVDVYPGMVGTVDTETIDLVRPADLNDLLRGQAGIDISGGPRRTGQTISLRGQGRDNATLLVDGARQNYASAHDGAIFIEPSLLVGVDTVRGPASALYGSGASGGVVAFRTASAHDLLSNGETHGLSVGAGYNTGNEEIRGTLTGYGVAGDFDFLGSITQRESGDIELGSGADLPSNDQTLSALLKVGTDFSDGVRGELTWQFQFGNVVEPNNGQGGGTVGPFNALADKNVSTNNIAYTLSAAPANMSWMNLDLTVYRNETGVDEYERAAARSLTRDLETTGIRADQRFALSIGQYDAGLTIGSEYYEDRQVGFDSADPAGIRGGAPSASSQFNAIYAQLEISGPAPFGIPGDIVFLPGIRRDGFDTESPQAPDTSNDETSSRFGFTYSPTDSFSIFANCGEAFRAPSINEMYIDGTHFSLPHIILGPPVFISNEFIANPNLMPESTKTTEFGFHLDLADQLNSVDRLDLRASWFQTDAENLIDLFVDFAFDPTCFAFPAFMPCSAGTTQSRNVAGAELEGFEAQFGFAAGSLSIDGSYSVIDGEDVATGDPLGSLVPNRLFLDGRWTVENRRLVLGARLEIVDDFDKVANPADARGGYTVVDFYTRWQPLANRGLFINAGVENAFDEDYEQVFAGVSEPARSVRLDLTWRKNF